MNNEESQALCGIWMNKDEGIHLCLKTNDGKRREEVVPFAPFFWCTQSPDNLTEETEVVELEGDGAFRLRIHAPFEDYQELLKDSRKKKAGTEACRPLEHGYLLQSRSRMFSGMTYKELRRCQLDIETACSEEGSFSNPRRKDDRVLAIGLRMNGETTLLHLEEDTDKAERNLLKQLNAFLQKHDPDIIEGHNIFKFDLEYLRRRSQRFKLPCEWGRFGAQAQFRNSRLRVAERWLDYPRCDIPGRTVVDTFFMVMMFDVSTRDLPSYSLKDVALYFKISDASSREYIDGGDIQKMFNEDRKRFDAYLSDDLRETAGVADVLLPTYVAQAANFPMTLQEILLRGTGGKVDSLFLEAYFHENHALPFPDSVGRYAGGFTKSYETGVFKKILHFDVASLYPSLLLSIGRNPANDALGVFIPLLKDLRSYRLDYKKRARETVDPELQREYNARQSAFKIIINSFYGYLGFEGARFADGELAAEVTERGRELLQALIAKFQELECTVLEADTDGIYLSSEQYDSEPEKLLEKVSTVLPEGIELEFDGRHEAMFCYKSKNYALYDGENVTIRGSALRSRGTEPFLKAMTDCLIYALLGASNEQPEEKLQYYREVINSGEIPIDQLAKREYLSVSPERYHEQVEKDGKSRRASLEAAARLERPMKSGDQVAYYITTGEKKRQPDWQVARPVEEYDPKEQPYNPDYYLRKLTDWEKRYSDFLSTDNEQGELF